MLSIHRIKTIRARHFPDSNAVELALKGGFRCEESTVLVLYFDNNALAEIFFQNVPEVGEQSADDFATVQPQAY